MKDLDKLRQDIDALDDQIHDLLKQRFEITAAVAAAKGAQLDPSRIPRPAREQAILARLEAQHAGALPVRSLRRIWKEIMGAAGHQQGDFRIGLLADPVSALAFAAREHFGTAVRLEFGPAEQIFADLEARKLALAVAPVTQVVPENLFDVGVLDSPSGALGRLLSVHDLSA